jgi:hypothetical protein
MAWRRQWQSLGNDPCGCRNCRKADVQGPRAVGSRRSQRYTQKTKRLRTLPAGAGLRGGACGAESRKESLAHPTNSPTPHAARPTNSPWPPNIAHLLHLERDRGRVGCGDRLCDFGADAERVLAGPPRQQHKQAVCSGQQGQRGARGRFAGWNPQPTACSRGIRGGLVRERAVLVMSTDSVLCYNARAWGKALPCPAKQALTLWGCAARGSIPRPCRLPPFTATRDPIELEMCSPVSP